MLHFSVLRGSRYAGSSLLPELFLLSLTLRQSFPHLPVPFHVTREKTIHVYRFTIHGVEFTPRIPSFYVVTATAILSLPPSAGSRHTRKNLARLPLRGTQGRGYSSPARPSSHCTESSPGLLHPPLSRVLSFQAFSLPRFGGAHLLFSSLLGDHPRSPTGIRRFSPFRPTGSTG